MQANMEVLLEWFFSVGDTLFPGMHATLPFTRPPQLSHQPIYGLAELRGMFETALTLWMVVDGEPWRRLHLLPTRPAVYDPTEWARLVAMEPQTSRRLIQAIRLHAFTYTSLLNEKPLCGVLVEVEVLDFAHRC